MLITAETESRDAVARNNAALANQINPNIAGGVFLDAIWALMGGERVKATPSLIRNVTLAGAASTIIPEGSRASVGTTGAVFELTAAIILNASGNGSGDFQCVTNGAVSVAAGALDTIVTSVLGWETVTNPTAAEEGADEESDTARARRRNTLALKASPCPRLRPATPSCQSVRSSVFRENVTASPVIEGVTLGPRSVYACVDERHRYGHCDGVAAQEKRRCRVERHDHRGHHRDIAVRFTMSNSPDRRSSKSSSR